LNRIRSWRWVKDSAAGLAIFLSYLGGTVASFTNGPSPRAGSDIVVYGFPLGGLLSEGGNVVTGNITALI
jgi:hypothetical protein